MNFKKLENYRTGGVFNPDHHFSLVEQEIFVNKVRGNTPYNPQTKKGSFTVRFPNIWDSYKLPRIENSQLNETYDNWLHSQMQFWQNQLNFAVWCATTGCGISKEDLNHSDPMIKSVFRFHTYYQIRRILSELQCPLPFENSFNPLNNGFNTRVYERICNEFGIKTTENWRQKYDTLNGFGSVRYYVTVHHSTMHGMSWKEEKVLKKGDHFTGMSSSNRKSEKPMIEIPSSGKFGSGPSHRYKVEYVEQYFDHDPGYSDYSSDRSIYAAIGSFILDTKNIEAGDTFTRAGISRINDSIRTYSWLILGSQGQTRSSILGSGRAYDTQKQFLANLEDSIDSEVDLPSSIDRYQRTLQYARSKLDFVIGVGLYMIPSNMDLQIGQVIGYNNNIQIATDEMSIGYNPDVNEELKQNLKLKNLTTQNDFDDFDEIDEIDDTVIDTVNDNADDNVTDTVNASVNDTVTDTVVDTVVDNVNASVNNDTVNTELTHDETRIGMILFVTTILFFIGWYKK